MDRIDTANPPPAAWIESLEEAERDADAGRVVPASEVHDMLGSPGRPTNTKPATPPEA